VQCDLGPVEWLEFGMEPPGRWTVWNDAAMPGSIHAHVVEGTRLRIEVVSDQGAKLTLAGDVTDLEPTVESDGVLKDNPALLSNAWAFAKTWYEARTTSYSDALEVADPEGQKAALKEVEESKKAAEKRAEAYAKVAQWIADVADDVSPYEPKHGWCSSCFSRAEHRKSNRPAGQLPVYVCQGCGSPTLPCVALGCEHLAVRERGAIRVPQYCAEHRHDIPGFEKAQARIGELHDYEELLTYEKPDLSKSSKLVAMASVGLVVGAPLAPPPPRSAGPSARSEYSAASLVLPRPRTASHCSAAAASRLADWAWRAGRLS